MSAEHPAAETLERFHDDALEPSARAEAARHVEGCEACRHSLESLVSIGDVVRDVARIDAAAFDPGRAWDRLAPSLEPAAAAPVPAGPGLLDRIAAWLAPGRLVPALAVAAAAVALLVFAVRPGPPGPAGKGAAAPPAGTMVSNECFVDSVESGEGDTVLIAQNQGPDASTVIWLLAENTAGSEP